MGGDLSFAAIYSLRAIDDWIAVLNANMGGSARVGYKASRVTFKGGTVQIGRGPSAGGMLPIQIPEQNLSNAGTSIDFSQGAIVASTEKTHFAVQGKGFYILAEDTNDDGIADNLTRYYSRDGEFHLNSVSYLKNSQGLLLMGTTGTAAGETGVKITNYDTIDPNTGVGMTINGVVAPLPVRQFNNEQALKYSKYGSTIFEQGSATAVVIMPTNLTVMQSLEASNVSLTQIVPELSLAQKMFSAISKVLQVSFQNIDTILNLIR